MERVEAMSVEGQVECACIKIEERKLIVLCIYRTGLGTLEVFFDTLTEILNHINKNFLKYKLVLCGDFNIDLLTPSSESDTFLNLLWGYSLQQLIFEPTRVTKQTATLLDNIFINFQGYKSCSVVNLAVSDHHAQLLSFNDNKITEQNDNVCLLKRIFSEGKKKSFVTELQGEAWDDVINSAEVNVAYDLFHLKFKSLMDRIFPIKKRFDKKKSSPKHWITLGIKTSSKKKRELYENVRLGSVSELFYKKYCSILKKVVKDAKCMSNRNFINESENKSKATWSIIKRVTKNNTASGDSILKNIKDCDASISPEGILNKVNRYLVTACPNITNNRVDFSKVDRNERDFSFTLTTSSEVKKTILALKNLRSVGEDEIPVSILKEAAHLVSKPLAHILNLAFCTGVYPEKLKTAYVKPIYKKGDKTNFKNYRPVSLLSNINKILEKIINNRLVAFFEECSILSNVQNGFRKGKSTTRAIYQAMAGILESLNDQKYTSALCIDLSKAFDSVDHTILSSKLEIHGIRGVSLSLLQSYLANRLQCVVEHDAGGLLVRSVPEKIIRGVPQGSILGPLLYIIYVNELPKITAQNMVQYADDTSVIFSEGSRVDCGVGVCETLREMEDWFGQNNLLLNVDKTQIISFRQQGRELSLEYNSKTLEARQHISFLGVTVDSRLDWREHIAGLSADLSKYNFALRVLSMSVDRETAMIAYHAYVHSRMSYGIIFWGGSVDAGRVFVLQKRCIRSIFGLKPRESCKPIFFENKILTLVSLYILECVMFIKKNPDLFQNNLLDHHYDTRHKQNFKQNKIKYTYTQKNVDFLIKKIWNKIPLTLRSLPTHKLKKKLKDFLLVSAFYTLQEFLTSDLSNIKL